MTVGNGKTEVWRQPNGYWRWQYVIGADGQEPERYLSHIDFPTLQEARHTAATAYPGVPIEDLTSPRLRRRRVARYVLGTAAAVVVGAVALRRAQRARQARVRREEAAADAADHRWGRRRISDSTRPYRR